ncbi:MAG: leucine-rich repeat protein [Sphingobacteriales bacterium]|nr:leucine-rich repeat protein [Sphingobacteriales bacterium]
MNPTPAEALRRIAAAKENKATTLDLSRLHLTAIPPELEGLGHLQELDLYANQISEIKELDKLINLKKLHLSNNNICEIKGLENLSNLQTLYLYRNQISEIKGLDKLNNLRKLYLYRNQISEIKGLVNLSNLQELYLSDNQISEIKGLENLSKLHTLDLYGNQISEIKGLENLSKLHTLDLSRNQIGEIKRLENLSNLHTLNLSRNQIGEIKGLDNLSKLQKLALFGNQISEIKGLDTLLHTLAQLEHLALWGNPLSTAADLHLKIDNNLSQIKEYLKIRSAEEQLISFHLPVKVLLLGNHGAGKSSLLHYLTTKELPEHCESTPILQIKAYPSPEKPEILYYDFGGQDYYHGLYKIFIRNPAAVQVLLFRQCHNRNHIAPDSEGLETVHFNVRYWLGQQKYVAEHQKKPLPSPPLLIRSHSDCEEELPFSALQDFNISEQHALILRRSLSTSLNELRLQVVAALLNESVEKHRTLENFADWYGDFYRYIMRQNQTANHEAVSVQAVVLRHFKGAKADREAKDSEQKRLDSLKIHLQMLCDATGLVLYYKDIAPDKIWLNPMAFVQHIHQNVFDKERIKDKKGRVAATVLEDKVSQPELELLQKQKVIFRHEYSDTGEPEYILPNYLPLANSDPQYELLRFGLEQQTAFKMRFTDFLPLGFINQLVDLFGKQPDKKIFWRDALIFTFERFAKVLIELNFEQLEIRVQVYFLPHHHPAAHHKDVLHYLFYTLLALYRDVEVLTYEAYRSKNTQLRADSDFEQHRWQEYEDLFSKAAPQDLYVALSDDNYVRFRDLCNKDENARRISACCFDEQNTIKSDTVQEVAIYPYQFFTNKTFKRMTRIFISYSKMDLPLILEFQDHLSALKRDNLVESWFCTELLAGGKWNNDIQEHFSKADMVCFMVSPNFMRTDYIYDYEIKRAFERQNEDPNFKIVPIILDFCRWKTQAYNLSDFTALPYTAKPICDFENRNLAWYIVIECLRISIEEGKYPNSEDYFGNHKQIPEDIKAYFKRIVAANKDGGKVP